MDEDRTEDRASTPVPDAEVVALRERVLDGGHAHAGVELDPLMKGADNAIVSFAWGSVWSNPALSLRDRSLVTVGMLTAQGMTEQLVAHVRAARRNGVTYEELVEVMLQAAVYSGVPRGNAGLAVVRTVVGGPAGG